MADLIATHVTDALARLNEQYKDKTKLRDALSSYASETQPLEGAMIQLLVERTVDTAIGAQLDAIGSIVGESRDGAGDDDYRRRIRARISVNSSDGLIEDLITVTILIIDDPALDLDIDQLAVASVAVNVLAPAVPTSLHTILFNFLRDTVGAGVKLTVESSEDVADEMFTFASSAFLSSASPVFDTLLFLDAPGAPLDWPASGSITLDPGLSVEETVTYSAISVDRLSVTCSLTANAHAVGAEVQLSGGPGKGFGDETLPATVGGKFAAASGN